MIDGTWGTCPWEISVDGTLTVHPGTGKALISGAASKSPWYSYEAYIKRIVFLQEGEQRVIAPQNSRGLFAFLRNVEEIDLRGLETSNVTSMESMFLNCPSLTSLDLTPLDTKNVTNMHAMFSFCSSLGALDLASLDTSSVTNMDSMFDECSSLGALDLASLDTSSVTDMRSMFHGCSSLASIDLTPLDTGNVTDMGALFGGCSSLASLDLTPLETKNVSIMGSMFSGCSSLTSIDLTPLDTRNVTKMSTMFFGCSSLASIDLTPLDTRKVTDMCNMFYGCSSLASIDLTPLDTRNVTNMRDMFHGCSSLASIDLTPLNTRNVTDMSTMFSGCSSLAAIDLTSLDTRNVTFMGGMFQGCSSLVLLDFASLDTKKVKNTKAMFKGCSSLAYVNLSEFDTSNVADMDGMFDGCETLSKIDLGAKFSFTGAKDEIQTMLPEGNWFSTKERNVYESQQIASNRNNTVDTYAKVPVNAPTITAGNGNSWLQDGADRAIFESDADFALFVGVQIDGVNLEESDYVAREGSTIVELNSEYLKTLALGEHTVGIVSANGTAEATFTITKSLESAAELVLEQERYVYNGTQKRPAITVKVGDEVLQEGVDYEVSYPDASAAVGIYAVTVTGKGNYTGTKTISYEILPASITDVTLSEIKCPYDGAQKRPSVTVKCGSRILATGSDYTVSYPASSSAVGIYTVTVTGKGNYTGTKQATFEIVEASKPTPDKPKPDNPGSVDPKPDDPSTHPDNPGTTDPGLGNPGTQPEDPGATDSQPDDPGTVDPEPVANQMMHRAYNPNSGEHFYTASYGEIEAIVAAGWQYEGEAWTAPVMSTVPVYRLYSGTDHHYTTSVVERDHLISVGWRDEGIGWYSDEAMGVGLHRLFNPNVNPNARRNNSGSHHYTTSDEERDFLVSIGWQYEGFGWYGVK